MAVVLVAAVLTAFYSLRLLLVVFHLPQNEALAAGVRAEQAAAQLESEHEHHHDHHGEESARVSLCDAFAVGVFGDWRSFCRRVFSPRVHRRPRARILGRGLCL